MTYIFNPNGDLTVMHLADHNRLGAIVGALCGARGFSRSCNLPLGQPVCTDCQRVMRQFERHGAPNGEKLFGLALKLMAEGVLSEGQVATASRLDRVIVRACADDLANAQPQDAAR